jgi:hypothetical protein
MSATRLSLRGNYVALKRVRTHRAGANSVAAGLALAARVGGGRADWVLRGFGIPADQVIMICVAMGWQLPGQCGGLQAQERG